MASEAGSGSPAGLRQAAFTKPKPPGKAGRPITLLTNAFRAKWHLSQLVIFVVEFDPPVDRTDLIRRETALKPFRAQLRKFGDVAYDGTRLYTTFTNQECLTLRNGPQSMRLVYSETLSFDKAIAAAGGSMVVHLCNIFFKQYLRKLKFVRLGECYFDMAKDAQILVPTKKETLTLYKGYQAALEVHQAGLFITVNPVHRVVREKSIGTLMTQEYQTSSVAAARKRIEAMVVGRKVMTSYNGMGWHVDAIDWTKDSSSSFTDQSGAQITFAQYYAKKYNIKLLQSALQPVKGLLVYQPKRKSPIYLMPDLCHLTGIDEDLRSNRPIMTALANTRAMTPAQRLQRARELLTRVSASPELKVALNDRLPMTLDLDPLQVAARVLTPFQLIFGEDHAQDVDNFYARYLRESRVEGLPPKSAAFRWLLVFDQEEEKNMSLATPFEKYVVQFFQELGINMLPAERLPIFTEEKDPAPGSNWATALRKRLNGQAPQAPPAAAAVAAAQGHRPAAAPSSSAPPLAPAATTASATTVPPSQVGTATKGSIAAAAGTVQPTALPVVNLVVTIAPTWASLYPDWYGTMKEELTCRLGVISQNVRAETVSQHVETTWMFICRQILHKLGFPSWKQGRSKHLELQQLRKQSTMCVGIDVCHYGQAGRSTAALAFTVDAGFTKHYSCMAYQKLHQEILQHAEEMMYKALCGYYAAQKAERKHYPQNIIIYRDGVGHGQFDGVLTVECTAFRRAFARIASHQQGGQPYSPRMLLCVVQKRVKARFFSMDLKAPPIGAVVDTAVVDPVYSDFFYVSSGARPGQTPCPTRFTTLFDELNLSNDALQEFTAHLCNCYLNFPGPIRVPAACMHAHKVAFYFGKTVNSSLEPVRKLNSFMYYL